VLYIMKGYHSMRSLRSGIVRLEKSAVNGNCNRSEKWTPSDGL
jgi:hypothetical protein